MYNGLPLWLLQMYFVLFSKIIEHKFVYICRNVYVFILWFREEANPFSIRTLASCKVTYCLTSYMSANHSWYYSKLLYCSFHLVCMLYVYLGAFISYKYRYNYWMKVDVHVFYIVIYLYIYICCLLGLLYLCLILSEIWSLLGGLLLGKCPVDWHHCTVKIIWLLTDGTCWIKIRAVFSVQIFGHTSASCLNLDMATRQIQWNKFTFITCVNRSSQDFLSVFRHLLETGKV